MGGEMMGATLATLSLMQWDDDAGGVRAAVHQTMGHQHRLGHKLLICGVTGLSVSSFERSITYRLGLLLLQRQIKWFLWRKLHLEAAGSAVEGPLGYVERDLGHSQVITIVQIQVYCPNLGREIDPSSTTSLLGLEINLSAWRWDSLTLYLESTRGTSSELIVWKGSDICEPVLRFVSAYNLKYRNASSWVNGVVFFLIPEMYLLN